MSFAKGAMMNKDPSQTILNRVMFFSFMYYV